MPWDPGRAATRSPSCLRSETTSTKARNAAHSRGAIVAFAVYGIRCRLCSFKGFEWYPCQHNKNDHSRVSVWPGVGILRVYLENASQVAQQYLGSGSRATLMRHTASDWVSAAHSTLHYLVSCQNTRIRNATASDTKYSH